MPRFTRKDVESVLKAIEVSAKMRGFLPMEAKLILAPGPSIYAILSEDGLQLADAPFLPEFEPNDTVKDMMRALTATLKVLYAVESKARAEEEGSSATADPEDSPIYYDTFIEDDENPAEYLPFKADTARIIDEGQGGVIAYCHVDTAGRIVEALRK